MQEQHINFETAKLAKEKGFILSHPSYLYDEYGKILNLKKSFDLARQTFLLDTTTTLAPSQSLLQKWLREVHGIYVYSYVGSYPSDIHKGYSDYLIQRKGFDSIRSGMTNTYEEALEEGLVEALKLIKKTK